MNASTVERTSLNSCSCRGLFGCSPDMSDMTESPEQSIAVKLYVSARNFNLPSCMGPSFITRPSSTRACRAFPCWNPAWFCSFLVASIRKGWILSVWVSAMRALLKSGLRVCMCGLSSRMARVCVGTFIDRPHRISGQRGWPHLHSCFLPHGHWANQQIEAWGLPVLTSQAQWEDCVWLAVDAGKLLALLPHVLDACQPDHLGAHLVVADHLLEPCLCRAFLVVVSPPRLKALSRTAKPT